MWAFIIWLLKSTNGFTKSIYENIRGLGKKRLKVLLQNFNGPKEISKLTPELVKVKTGIPIEIVKEIIKISKTNAL